MSNYKEIKCTNYFIQELKCRCSICGFEFLDYLPLNYELVCFIDSSGEKYFMPTYGENGYLELLQKVVEGWKTNEQITRNVVIKFEEKLVELTPHPLSLFQKVKCPACSKDDIIIIQRLTLKNPPIKWVKINIEHPYVLKNDCR